MMIIYVLQRSTVRALAPIYLWLACLSLANRDGERWLVADHNDDRVVVELQDRARYVDRSILRDQLQRAVTVWPWLLFFGVSVLALLGRSPALVAISPVFGVGALGARMLDPELQTRRAES